MNTFYLLIFWTTIAFSSENTNPLIFSKKPSNFCLIRCIIYSTKNVFQYYISPFLFSEDLVKIFNSFKFDAQNECDKIEMLFPNSEWKTYVLIQSEQQASTLYHFLKDENFTDRLILFSEKTKTAKALHKNFNGCNENLVTVVYDDIVPFDSVSYDFVFANEKRIMIVRTKDKYTVLLKTKEEFSTICFGTYFWKNDDIILQNQDQGFTYPYDLKFLLKAKESKKYLALTSILFWNKNFIQNYFKFYKLVLSPANVISCFISSFVFALGEYLVYGEVSIAYLFHNNIGFLVFLANIFPYSLPAVPFLFPIWYYSVSTLQFVNTTLLLPLIPLSMAFNYFSVCLKLPHISLPVLENELISTSSMPKIVFEFAYILLILKERHTIRNLSLQSEVFIVFFIIYLIQIWFFDIYDFFRAIPGSMLI